MVYNKTVDIYVRRGEEDNYIVHSFSLPRHVYQYVNLMFGNINSDGIKLALGLLCSSLDKGVFDFDNDVDLEDLGIFVIDWLWQATGMDPYRHADLNCDGVIDLHDFKNVSINWLADCP